MSNQSEPSNRVDVDSGERDDSIIATALYWSLAVFLVLLLFGGGLVLWLMRSKETLVTKAIPVGLPEARKLPDVEIPEMKFTDVTRAAGIRFVHQNGANGNKLLPETMGGGCAFLDFDNDGDQDILFINSRPWPWNSKDGDDKPATLKLYQNDGTGRFEDVTAGSGLDVSLYGMGVAVGDYDNDGDPDLYVTAVAMGSEKPNRLFRNDDGKFVDVTERAGVAGGAGDWGTSCGWFDYDNDGDLDLFVCNYVRWSKEFDLAQNFQLTGGGRAYGRPQAFDGSFPHLYRNDGAGKFTNVSEEAGIQIRNPATNTPMGKALGVVFADFDSDGRMDIVVANDTVQNFLFHNQPDGTFREIGAISGVAFGIDGNATGAMGMDVARFRNSDVFGIAVGNFSQEMTALYVSRAGGIQFSDEAVSNGLGPVTRLMLTFGLFFFDCDLDGRLDLLCVNGHLEEDINLVEPSQHYEQPPQLFWNTGPQYKTEFLPVPAEKCGEDFTRPLVGRGATFADIDNDGDLDVLLTATGQTPRLLRNDQQLGHHWLRLKLVGSESNRDAIGTWVEVTAGGRTVRQQVMPTRSYLSQSELPLTFGLGEAIKIDALRIHWPSGKTSELNGIEIDRLHVVHEEKGTSENE